MYGPILDGKIQGDPVKIKILNNKLHNKLTSQKCLRGFELPSLKKIKTREDVKILGAGHVQLLISGIFGVAITIFSYKINKFEIW